MPLSELEIIFNLNDNVILVENLRDSLTNAYQNEANVTATLKDDLGAIVGGINNVPCIYVANSNGHYRGAIPDTFNEEPGYYTLYVDAVQFNLVAHWEKTVQVKIRKWDYQSTALP